MSSRACDTFAPHAFLEHKCRDCGRNEADHIASPPLPAKLERRKSYEHVACALYIPHLFIMDRCRNCGDKEASHEQSMGTQPPELLLAPKAAPPVNKMFVRAKSVENVDAVTFRVNRPKPSQLDVMDRSPLVSGSNSPRSSRVTPAASQPTTPRLVESFEAVKAKLRLEDQNLAKCRNAAVVAELTAIESLALARNMVALWELRTSSPELPLISPEIQADVEKQISAAEDAAESIRQKALTAIAAAENSNASQAAHAAEEALEQLGDMRKYTRHVLAAALVGDPRLTASLAGCQMAEIQALTMSLVASESSKQSSSQTAMFAAKKWVEVVASECDKVVTAMKNMSLEEANVHRDAAWRAAMHTRACAEIVSSVALKQHEGLVPGNATRAQAAVLAAENAAARCLSLQQGVEASFQGSPPQNSSWARLEYASTKAQRLAATARDCLGSDHQVAQACATRDEVEGLLAIVEQESEKLLGSQVKIEQFRTVYASSRMGLLLAQADIAIAASHLANSDQSVIEAAKYASLASAQDVHSALQLCEVETDPQQAPAHLACAELAQEATSQSAALLYSILVNLEQAKTGFLLEMEPPLGHFKQRDETKLGQLTPISVAGLLSEENILRSPGLRSLLHEVHPVIEDMGESREEERVALRTLVARRVAAEHAREGITRKPGLDAKAPVFELHSANAIRAAHMVKRAAATENLAAARAATELMGNESELARKEVVDAVRADLEPSVWLERVMSAARTTEDLNARVLNSDPAWSFTLHDLNQRALQIVQYTKEISNIQPELASEADDLILRCNDLAEECSSKSTQETLPSEEARALAERVRGLAKQTLVFTSKVSSNEAASPVEGANQAANEMLQIVTRLEPNQDGDTAQMVEWADATIQCVITQHQRAMEAYTMGRLEQLHVQATLDPRLYPDYQAIIQATYSVINTSVADPEAIVKDMELKQLQQQADAEVSDLQNNSRFKIQTVIAVYYPPTSSLTKREQSPSVSKLVVVERAEPEPSISLEVNPKSPIVEHSEQLMQMSEQSPMPEVGAFGATPTVALLATPAYNNYNDPARSLSEAFDDDNNRSQDNDSSMSSSSQGQPRLKLHVKARNLLQFDWTTTLDPLVALYQLDDDLGTYHLVQQTEVLQDSLDPDFSTAFTMRYKPDMNQQFLLRVYAVSASRLGDEQVLGSAVFSLEQIMKEKELTEVRLSISNYAELLLDEQLKKASSCVIVSYEYDFGKKEPIAEVELSVCCQYLPAHLENFQKCVPLVSLFREDKQTGMFEVVDQTEKCRTESVNPMFKKKFLLSHNPEQPLWYKVSVFNLKSENSAIKIGSARVDMVDLAGYGNKKTYVLTNPSLDLGGASVVFQCVKRVEQGSKLGQQIVTEHGVPELDAVVDEAKTRRKVTESLQELTQMMSMGRGFRRLWTKDTATRLSLFLNPNDNKLFWCPETWDLYGTKQVIINDTRSMKLIDISHIILGKQTSAFQTSYVNRMSISAACCFSLLCSGEQPNILNLAATTELQRDAWVCGLRMVAIDQLNHNIQLVDYGEWKQANNTHIEEIQEETEASGLTTVWEKLNVERARKREAAERNKERLEQINNTGQLFNMGMKTNNVQNLPLFDPDSEADTKEVKFADMSFSCSNLPASSFPYTICVWQRDIDSKDWMYVSKTDNIRGQSPVFKKRVKIRYWGMNQVVKFVVCVVQGHKITDADCVGMYKTSLSTIMSGKKGIGHDGLPANKNTPGALRFGFELTHPEESGQRLLTENGAILDISCERMVELQNKQPLVLASTNKAPIRAMIRGTKFWIFSATGPPQERTVFFRKDELKELRSPMKKKKDSTPAAIERLTVRPSLLQQENVGQLFYCDVGQTVELPGCNLDVSCITDVYLGVTGPAFQNPLSLAQKPEPSRCLSLVCGSFGSGPRLDMMAPSAFLRDSWVGGIQSLLRHKVVVHPSGVSSGRRLSTFDPSETLLR